MVRGRCKKKEIKDAPEAVKVIERGSIVSLSEQPNKCKRYMVLCVYNKVGSKWNPSAKGDNPSWPLQTSDEKKYRVLIRSVLVTEVKGQRGVHMDGGKKVDAELISVKQLGELHFCVEY